MNTGEIILFVFVLLVSLAAFAISWFQFREKGFLFNNAYLYASQKERETMNKKPYYRQSAIVFLVIGIAFLLLAMGVAFAVQGLYTAVVLLMAFLIVYAIVSSIRIWKSK